MVKKQGTEYSAAEYQVHPLDSMAKDIYALRLTPEERLRLLDSLRDYGNPHHTPDNAKRKKILSRAVKEVLGKNPDDVGLGSSEKTRPKIPEVALLNVFDALRAHEVSDEERSKIIDYLKQIQVDFFDLEDVKEGVHEALERLAHLRQKEGLSHAPAIDTRRKLA